MVSISQNISLYQRDSETITITARDTSGTLINLTGAVLRWVLWHALKGVVLTKASNATPTPTITILNQGTNPGQCTITLTTAETKVLAPLTYNHLLHITPVSGDTQMIIASSTIEIKPAKGMEVAT